MDENEKLVLDDKTEFVCFSMPGTDDFTLAYIQTLRKTDSLAGQSNFDFVFAPFDRKKNSILLLEFSDKFKNRTFDFRTTRKNPDHATSRGAYEKAFGEAMEKIRNDGLDKLVLSRVKIEETGPISMYDVFMKLIGNHREALVYFINTIDGGTWMGATPEILLTKSDGLCRTVALAGTRPIPEDSGKVRWSPKEHHEQDIIVQYLEEALRKHNILAKHSKCYTVKAGKMAHLKTDFIIRSPHRMNDLIEIFHPGPALSGRPIDKAKKAIHEIETHDRKYYTGYLGPVHENGNFDFYVNLRCMQVYENSLTLYLGGGLLEESVLEEEWEETELKSTTMLSALPDNRKEKV